MAWLRDREIKFQMKESEQIHGNQKKEDDLYSKEGRFIWEHMTQ